MDSSRASQSSSDLPKPLVEFLSGSASANTQAPAPLRATALVALLGLATQASFTSLELAAEMKVKRETVSALLSDLETQGLIEKKDVNKDLGDCFQLTLSGRKLLNDLTSAQRGALRTQSGNPALQAHSPDAATNGGFSSPACSMPEIED